MRVACVTDDGITNSQHFGRAPYYAVLTVEDGAITARELRDKMGHNQFVGEEHVEVRGQRHGTDAASHDKHTRMASAISDCEALLCRGMGWGAYDSMKQLGIKPVVTDIANVEDAVKAYAAGTIVDHTDRLH
jgi:predicted Fe-Mo cluster-binding NifX family protein